MNDNKEIPELNNMEARVLGALMEKQLTTPDAYPLTLNSLVLACNQKTSREPVSNYNEGEVQRCLENLRERKLIDVEYGSRANRYDQRLSRVLYLEKPAQAVLTIMLLRGPQTVNELLSRTQRMADLSSEHQVQELLDLMCSKTKPIFCKLHRQSGQREDRYGHLLCGQLEHGVVTNTRAEIHPQFSQQNSSDKLPSNAIDSKQQTLDDLNQRVEALERQVKQLLMHLNLSED